MKMPVCKAYANRMARVWQDVRQRGKTAASGTVCKVYAKRMARVWHDDAMPGVYAS